MNNNSDRNAKIKLASRLFNNQPMMVNQSNDRPLTAKIAIRNQLNQSKLPSIIQQQQQVSTYPSRGKSRGHSQHRDPNKSDLVNESFPTRKHNITYDIPEQIFVDERRWTQQKQVKELMERMIGKGQNSFEKPLQRESSKLRQRTAVLPSMIMEDTEEKRTKTGKTIRTASQKGQRIIPPADNSSDDSEAEDGSLRLKDVDTFIQMINDHKLSQKEFMYLVKTKKNNNDAYNMKVVGYNYIEKHKLNNYYTLSTNGLTRYENHISIEFVGLGTWLQERDQFNAIKSLSFFRKFRMWKTLKKWTKILHNERIKQTQAELVEKMLILNPIYQKLILQHRSLCFDIESLRIVDGQEFENCRTIEEFQKQQENQRNILVQKIQLQSEKMRENCQQGLKTVIEKLRIQINQEMTSEEEQVRQPKQQNMDKFNLTKKTDIKKQVIESFGFPENMNYGHRAMMRTEFVRFLRLAYLLDFLAVQSLGQIYIKSASEFIDKFSTIQQGSINQRRLPLPEITKDNEEQKRFGEYQQDDPIYIVNIKWMQDDRNLQIDYQQIPWEEMPLLDFDLEECIFLKQEVKQTEVNKDPKHRKLDQAPELVQVSIEEPEHVRKRLIINLYDQQLRLEPNKREFLGKIQDTFSMGLDSIQVVERWSKHPDFLPYVQALEEWDEIIGEKWSQPDSIHLNPSYWIKEHPMNNIFLNEIEFELDEAYDKLKQCQMEFNDYLELIWRQENSNKEELKNPLLLYQNKLFSNCLKQGQAVDIILKHNIPTHIDIGLFRVRVDEIQKMLASKQQQILIKLEECYINLFRQRSQGLKQWLQQSIKQLSGMVIKIEEFIEQKNSLDRISNELPQKREEIEIMSNLIALMNECQLTNIKKEDKDLAQDLNYLESSLNVAISEADNNTAKNIERFKKTLKDKSEKLKSESVEMSDLINKEKYLQFQTPIEEAIKELKDYDEKTKVLEQLAEKYVLYEEILQCTEQASYDALEGSRAQLNLRLDMWTGIQEFRKLSVEWIELPFGQINAKDMANKTEGFVRIVQRCEKNLQENKVIQYLKKIVWEFKDTIPVVTALRSPYLQNSHWNEIKALVKSEFDVNDQEFTLYQLLDLNVAQHSEAIAEIAVQAAQEDALNTQLKAYEQHWSEVELTLKPYKDQVDVMVLSEVEELMQLFDEGLANMSNLLASRYLKPLRQRAEKFYSDLLLLSDILDKWVECQKKWLYLESIFTSQDIKKQLSNESLQFEQCDRTIKKLVKTVNLRPQILRLLGIQNLYDNLSKTFDTLEQIEKSLEEYLDSKRVSFPRFYFLSNEELLEILSKQTDLQQVQQHLGKCFEALVRLYFGDQSQQASNIIFGIYSPENELIPYYKPIPARGNVEVWLHLLEIEMVDSLRKLTKQGQSDYLNGLQKTKIDWIMSHKSQVVSVVSQILWSADTQDAINESSVRPNSLYELYDQMIAQLNQLTQQVRGNLTQIQRKMIVSLITVDVHNRDVVLKLADNSVESISDFLWQQQLRYYWEEEQDDCLVKQVTSVFHYGYEYLGPTSRLVITPLTDRCWITITSALANQLGAAPAGPAGTGKTESTKDLAKCLGRYCIVFNCSDQITAVTMKKLFSGLVQQGAWACLDEFNRIDIEVLSVIAQQLLTIRLALLQNVSEFNFDGKVIPIKSRSMNDACGVFITMNPGYAGRTELPDNLKTLFRPVAMMIPNYRLIAEIMLFAEGFENANDLSSKMVQLYKLSSQQLSQQDHYDFGMRAVKSLLVMAGSLKRADTSISEEIVLIRAMKDANIPKFLKDDIPLFQALIQDLFPKVEIQTTRFDFLERALEQQVRAMKLQILNPFITKTLQLFDTINVRFGTMIVGGSGSGKSCCYQLLAETLTQIRAKDPQCQDQRFQLIKYYVINPKSINMGELYGEVDPFTNEWQDGLASSIIRECNNSKQPDEANLRHWIVFDGPVDALWIENMNSVLDDSMTLCLANSERIKLRHELRMLFEVQDLAVASPATVSRCGMVYMDTEDINWYSYVECWIERQFIDNNKAENHCCSQFLHKKPSELLSLEQKYIDLIKNLFKIQFSNLLERFKYFKESFETISIQRTKNVCNILQVFLNNIKKGKEDLSKKITIVFAFSVIWGMCASFEQEHYEQVQLFNSEYYKNCSEIQPLNLDEVLRFGVGYLHILSNRQERLRMIWNLQYSQTFAIHLSTYLYKLSLYIHQIRFLYYFQIATHIKDQFQSLLYPKCDTIFDFFIDIEDQYNLQPWEAVVEEFQYVKDSAYFSIVVNTVDTLKYSSIISMLTLKGLPTLLAGQTGVGKSMLVQSLLYKLKDENAYQPIQLNFSAQTKSKQTQLAIESKLIKKGKILFGARVNESIAIFIDDVNMPALEQFGAQPCIEFLRQMLELEGLYDRTKLFWKHIEDVTVLCAGGPPGGGRNQLSQRFLRQFNILSMPLQSDTIFEKIYGQILRGYLQSVNFSEQVRRMSDTLTKMTIELFRRISSELLPIPAKFHYTFNSRDISKVFQGLLMVKPISINSANNPTEQMSKLWLHECGRVFCDRLVNEQDRVWFYQVANSYVNKNFSIELSNTVLFSDILKLEAANILYEDVSEKRKVIMNALYDKLSDYVMETNDKMELVFFDDALEHILRIARIFRQPRGNAMLIGVGGSGKQSLTKLSAYLMKMEIFQIEIVKNYNQESFRTDLQKILMKSGVDRVPLTFIFTESQIVYESFLEDINNILNTGEVPNLFAKKEEMEAIYNGVRPTAIKQKRLDSPESLWNFFVEGVRNNLHIVLCMSPVGNQLRVRSRKFPSLINCCTLDWYSQWPKEALLEVANTFLEKLEHVDVKEQLAQMCMEVQVNVQELCAQYQRELRRQVYTTPKSYLDQIKLYISLYTMKWNEYSGIQKKLADGLDKLFKANETVAVLKVEMQEMQPQLVEQQTKTEQFLYQLSIDQGEANLKERLVNDEAQVVNQQAFEIKLIADEAQGELNKALPALREAEEALQKINKNDIAEIKGFISPPPIVMMVLEAVCILLQEKTDWNSAKQVMLGSDFMDRLVKYDKNAISDQMMKRLRLLTNKPEFEPIFVGQKSQACKSLCMWCRAIDNYHRIFKEVEPKKKRVSEMQQKLEVKNKELAVKQDELQKVRDRVNVLQRECDETVEKKNHLERELEKTKKRLIAAEKLTHLLSDEGIRWKEQIKTLNVTLQNIIGDVFLAATTVSYLGAFTGSYRESFIKAALASIRNLKIPCSDQYSLSGTLETPITIRDWVAQGLPNDNISVDNGIIAMRCDRWPLMIDPQSQANKWLKAHYRELKVLRFSETHFLKILQSCISSGFEVLFEEVEEQLEASIDSVLQKQIFEVEGRRLIKVGDSKVDYNQQFKMYLTTKIANPSYLPEVFIKTTVINFSITFEGLQDQLLSDVMLFEKPEIERQRDEIIIKMSNARKSLKQAQDQILDLLANAQGMILDNDQLINTLELSKFQSQDIQKSLEETQLIESQINESRNLYFSVATRGTIIYFVITEMSLIDPMYQYSLQYFKKLFKLSMSLTPNNDILQERLSSLERTITLTIFQDICRGLFQQHKRIFSFLICTAIRRQAKTISKEAWNLLLRDQTPQEPMLNPDKQFLKDGQWNMILCMQEQLSDLSDFAQDVKNNLMHWRDYIQNDELYTTPFPQQSPLIQCNNFNHFHKLLIIKALKPEKFVNSMLSYIREQIGKLFTEIGASSMEEVYQTSDAYTPIIFILSPGADPTQTLFKLAKEQQNNIDVISLGQGQGAKAESMILRGQKDGNWVMLQNCHLARSWMSQLEKLMEQLTQHQIEVHQNFRIFLTSMPVPYFPVSTLQNGLKLTTEPPRGLKANLRRSYQEFQFDEQMLKNAFFKQLFFSISFFHAIVQERRKFGPLGFNISYEFNDSDLDISIQMMRMFINTEEDIPWDAMQFMVGQINYGGRVTDDQDRVCLTAILRKYLGDHIEEKCKFSQSGVYYIPNDGDADSYLQYIDTLPSEEDPEVFGMHENANIVFQTQESQKVVDTILSIQPRVSTNSEGAKSPDVLVTEKAIFFQSQLPEKLLRIDCNPKHFQLQENSSIQSLSTVLFQEIDKFNVILDLIASTLHQLQQAIKGVVLISQELDEMYVAFLNNQIPPNWLKKSYATLKPLASWFKDLIARVAFIKQWMEKDSIPAYWMSGLFYPQGFLTGVLQTHSRKYKTPINKLTFKFKVLDTDMERIREEAKDGVYVYGLYLEGARWDYQHETLTEQQIGQIYYPLSIMLFLPMEEYEAPDDYYSCPCYKTSTRTGVLSTTGQSTNFILSIDLQSRTEKPEFWTLRGTAILSQLND